MIMLIGIFLKIHESTYTLWPWGLVPIVDTCSLLKIQYFIDSSKEEEDTTKAYIFIMTDTFKKMAFNMQLELVYIWIFYATTMEGVSILKMRRCNEFVIRWMWIDLIKGASELVDDWMSEGGH